MAWHDQSPWRAKRKAELVTVTDRIADVERRCRAGDAGLHEALIEAYTIGVEAGRANPAVERIGEAHTPEIKS